MYREDWWKEGAGVLDKNKPVKEKRGLNQMQNQTRILNMNIKK